MFRGFTAAGWYMAVCSSNAALYRIHRIRRMNYDPDSQYVTKHQSAVICVFRTIIARFSSQKTTCCLVFFVSNKISYTDGHTLDLPLTGLHFAETEHGKLHS